MNSRLLHPQHLDGIWIGQDQYRMPLASLSEYPNPGSEKLQEGVSRALNVLEL